MWNDILNPDVTLQTLWTRYPSQMMGISPEVYELRGLTGSANSGGGSGGSGGSVSSIDPAVLAALVADLADGTLTTDQLMIKYPAECVQFGANIIALSKGDNNGINDATQLRYKNIVASIIGGTSIENLINQYPDILAYGFYDVIQLTKYLRTGKYPA